MLDHLNGVSKLARFEMPPMPTEAEVLYPVDMADVKGQEHVKRAVEVAAAGAHNVLMTGPPGAGKTLISRAVPSILPPMAIEEALDVTKVYSVSGLLPADTPLILRRPFRSPHHTISHAGLVGGGHWPRPGEISLAHRGVLFLDELPEFGARVLEVLRQPLEDKVVTISRAAGTLTFPANFVLTKYATNDPALYARLRYPCARPSAAGGVGVILPLAFTRQACASDRPTGMLHAQSGGLPPDNHLASGRTAARVASFQTGGFVTNSQGA